jgi:hypothetical protein
MKPGTETLAQCRNHFELILNVNKRLAKRIQEQREIIKQLEQQAQRIGETKNQTIGVRNQA